MSEARGERVGAALAERDLDAIVVTHPVNVRWLSGFTGTNAVCVVRTDGARVFVTDFRYVEQAQQEVAGFEQEQGKRDLLGEAAAHFRGRVGFEDAHVPVQAWRRLEELAADGVELVGAGALLEGLRAVKEPAELDAIRAAAKLADAVLQETIIDRGLAGRSEREVAKAFMAGLREHDAEPSFPPIVAAGAHGALPHAEPRDAEIPQGTLVVVDFGAQLDGYCSDCTRTFATGQIGDGDRDVYELVQRAQAESLAAVQPGAACKEVDGIARSIIEGAGHGERFGHGLGHGVGLEVHEEPRLTSSSTDTLEPGNVVSVEPGVYIPGDVGVRIEDLVALTDAGHEVLSSVTKELTQL